MSPRWKSSRNAPRSSRKAKGQEVAEPAAAPVILRWQDLDNVSDFEVIIKAPEEKNLPRGKGKGKGKGKEKEKEKGKGKAQIGDNKAKGPPLANYIKASEFNLACKMCCNTDYHATFQCPNLTPELKEYLKEERTKCATFKPFHPDDQTCHICLKKGDHWTSACSYLHHYPAGAIVGPSAAIVCKCCGDENAHPGKPGVDWDAKVFRKICWACVCPSDHWSIDCPKREALLAAAAIKASESKGASAAAIKASESKGAAAIKASESNGAAAGTVTSMSRHAHLLTA